MKKIYFLVFFILNAFLMQAQRFFYLETNPITDVFLQDRLLKGSQFVVKSPLISDYIIKADAGFEEGSHILNLKMTVRDSLTSKTIFQSKEEYIMGDQPTKAGLILWLAVKTFIYKNMDQIILCTKDDHYDSRMKWLKPKKDKT